MGLAQRLKQKALGLSQQAISKLFENEQRATQIASALGAVQRGKASLDQGQRVVLNQLNFASKGDFKDLGKQLSGLKRRVRDLSARLDQLP